MIFCRFHALYILSIILLLTLPNTVVTNHLKKSKNHGDRPQQLPDGESNNFQMTLFNDQLFSDEILPHHHVLINEDIFVKITVPSKLTNKSVQLKKCYTSPSVNSSTSYVFIENHCPIKNVLDAPGYTRIM